MIENLLKIVKKLVGLLPDDTLLTALESRMDTIEEYLGYINYFIPFRGISTLFSSWLGLITAYFVYVKTKKYILKYAKKLGDTLGGLKNFLPGGGDEA